MNKFATGIVVGSLIGAAATMATNMDNKSRRRMRKKGKRMMNRAEEVIDNIMDMM